MEKPFQTAIATKRTSLWVIAAVVALLAAFGMPSDTLADAIDQDLVSSGSSKQQTIAIRIYGVAGQSSPLGTAETPAGKRLFSGNLLSAAGIGASSPQDTDGDGTPDRDDDLPTNPNETVDTDGDGDGTPDGEDDFPLDPDEAVDTDGDLIGDNADTDDDNDNISDQEEDQAPNNGDGNDDGFSDSLQAHVTSLRIYDGVEYVTLASEPGTTLTQVEAAPNPSPGDAPGDVAFTYGFFNFTISGIGSGPATLSMYLPAGTTPVGYYKYGRTPDNDADHWYDFMFDGTTGAEIDANVITLTFVDADRGDDVLTADSLIIDLGGPTFALPEDDGDGDGGGGSDDCFIQSLGLAME
jgi:hypothetical protein